MKTDKALDLIATHVSYLDGNVAMHEAPSRIKLRQALQALEKFRGAVEVELKIDPLAGISHSWIESVPDAGNTPKNYTLYAIPKEKQ
jgi:hypothetical protein